MQPELESILIGTLGLDVLLALAVYQSLTRMPQWQVNQKRLISVTGLAVGCHIIHSLEEWHFEFYSRFPALLGLAPWPESFFVTFNSLWVVAWCLSIPALSNKISLAIVPIWFLALASVANGLFHPIVALLQLGYFPGLVTALPVGVVGAYLLVALLRFTTSKQPAPP